MSRTESKHELTTTTSSKPSDFNVIESLQQYNRSQINKILCIENDTKTALDHDVVVVVDGQTTHENELPQPADITKAVKCNAIRLDWIVCVKIFKVSYSLSFFLSVYCLCCS